jgi:DNA sulfur modification protein DndB
LNKYAEKPKEAELIILDEDDASAILTRRLLEEHYILSIENVISSTNSPSIPTTDSTSFTTIVMINRINKEILKHHNLNYTIRPTQEDLDLYFIEVSNFWDYLFSSFPNIDRWLNGSEIRFDNGDLFNRNNDTGGSLILRPIGQHLFAKIYNTRWRN